RIRARRRLVDTRQDGPMSDEPLDEYQQERVARGLPPQIEDPAILARAAAVLRTFRRERHLDALGLPPWTPMHRRADDHAQPDLARERAALGDGEDLPLLGKRRRRRRRRATTEDRP